MWRGTFERPRDGDIEVYRILNGTHELMVDKVRHERTRDITYVALWRCRGEYTMLADGLGTNMDP